MSDKRLSICYAAPGLNLLPTAGPTRNVLSVAEALGQRADVTIAFRHVSQPIETDAYGVMAIEPSGYLRPTVLKDDTATGVLPACWGSPGVRRALQAFQHWTTCRRVRRRAGKGLAAVGLSLSLLSFAPACPRFWSRTRSPVDRSRQRPAESGQVFCGLSIG